MVQNMNERLLAKIHIDKILSEPSRREEFISIVAFYFAQHPNTKAKWEARYDAEIKFKNKPKKTKGKYEQKNENLISIVPDSDTE